MQTVAGAPALSATAAPPVLTSPHLLECPDCGQFQHLPAVAPGTVARCRRCDAVLRRTRRDPFGLPLMLIVTALLLFAIACSMTLMAVSTAGIQHTATLFSGPEGLDGHGFWELAVLVAFTTIGAPLFMMGSLLYVLVGLRISQPPLHMRTLLGWIERLRPWAMVDVYLLGLFVAYVKLQPLVRIELGPAFYALCALMITMIAAAAMTDPEAIWEELDRRGVKLLRPDPPDEAAGRPLALIGCHVCGQVSWVPDAPRTICPRCATPLHRRKRHVIGRCWALVIASVILYIPANVYPILTLIRLGSGGPSTIIGGVQELLKAGQWPLAVLVFAASVMVPVLKLVGLSVLLISVQLRWTRHLHDRTVLYRIVNTIGRWSMIDIFMESLLVALVQFGKLSMVDPGIGAIAFASVVVLTMLAAECFDPRLLWDAAGANPQ
jgi:paraquat-inducible protein A